MAIDFEKGLMPETDLTGGGTIKIDPTKIRGLEGYQPGDKVSAKVDFTLGTPGEDGMAEMKVDRIVADDQNPAKKAGREMMGEKKPNLEGTNLGGMEEIE